MLAPLHAGADPRYADPIGARITGVIDLNEEFILTIVRAANGPRGRHDIAANLPFVVRKDLLLLRLIEIHVFHDGTI